MRKTGKFIAKRLNRNEQKEFLNSLIDRTPWHLKNIVGKIDAQTGVSKHGFDMSLVDSKHLNFANGYITGNQNQIGVLSKQDATKPLASIPARFDNLFDNSKTDGLKEKFDVRALKEYLALGLDPRITNVEGSSILFLIVQDNPEILKETLPFLVSEYNVDLNQKDRYGWNMLHHLSWLHTDDKLIGRLSYLTSEYEIIYPFEDMSL